MQRLVYIVLYREGDALKWWKSNKHRFNTWEEVKDAIREYHDNHYKLDRAFNKINNLKQTDTMQKYVNNIDRHNVCAKMTDYHLINIISNHITTRLRQAMAYYEDLRSDQSKWKEKVLHMDYITSNF